MPPGTIGRCHCFKMGPRERGVHGWRNVYPGIGDRGADKYVMLVVDVDPLDGVGVGGAC